MKLATGGAHGKKKKNNLCFRVVAWWKMGGKSSTVPYLKRRS